MRWILAGGATARMFTKMRKAQVQMGESITIMIIVILLVVFGFIFYTKWSEARITSASSSMREEDAFATATIAASLPELQCSKNNVLELNCYDMLKIKHMNGLLYDSEKRRPFQSGQDSASTEAFFFYSNLFRNARVSVYEVYPGFYSGETVPDVNGATQGRPFCQYAADNGDGNNAFYCVIYDKSPAEVRQKIPARIPIKLYNPLTEEFRYGVIEVVRYFG